MNTSTKLLIARHGNTFSQGEVVRRVGITDLSLVESGMLQGEKLGEYLKTHRLIPDIIYTSQLQRTKQTAEQIKHVLQKDVRTLNLSIFNEIDYGPDENQSEQEVIARLGQEALQQWEDKAIVPQGWNVSPVDIIANWQLFAGNIEAEYSGKTILVITSNGIARFSPYLTGDFSEFASVHRIKIATGALCVFQKNSDTTAWECLEWNIKPSF